MKTEAQLMNAAISAGVLPANATASTDEQAAPWPVVLLGFFGAQFAVIPIFIFFAFVSGGFFFKGVATYILAVLLIAAGVALLRMRDKQGFMSHVALTVLLTGDGCLAYALFRDVGMQGISIAAIVLCIVQLFLAGLIQLRWAQTVLGALAALAFLWIGNDGWFHNRSGWIVTWAMPIIAAAVWCTAVLSEPRWSARAWAQAANAVLLGWAVGLLGMFVFTNGAVGAAVHLGGGMTMGLDKAMPLSVIVTKVLSVLAVLVCGLLLQSRWASKARIGRTGALLWLAYATLALFAWFAGSVPTLVILATGAVLTQRWRVFGLAVLGLVFALSNFYYQLDWRLVDKALLLAATGAALLLGTLVLSGRMTKTSSSSTIAAKPAQSKGMMRWVTPLIALGAVLSLGVANWNIAQKERVIAQGNKLYVALAPRDPRSLMQGDYMALNFAMPPEVLSELAGQSSGDIADTHNRFPHGRSPLVVAKRDERGVATVTRIAKPKEAIANDELLLPVKFKNHRWVLVSDAFFFPEGKGKSLEGARFGELRALGNGQALLVGLSDDKLKPLVAQ